MALTLTYDAVLSYVAGRMHITRPAGSCHSHRPLTHLLDPTERQDAVKATRTCSVDGCKRPSKARGWCLTHYCRWRATGDPGPAEIVVRHRGVCRLSDCDEPHSARGYCAKHYDKVRRFGDPHHVARRRLGATAPNWRGEDVAYSTVHSRLIVQRGLAVDQMCQHCGDRARTWAYDHACPNERVDPKTDFTFSVDLTHYMPLCKSCHSRFDIGRTP